MEFVLQHKGTKGGELKFYSGQYCLSWHLFPPSMKINTTNALEPHILAFPNRKKILFSNIQFPLGLLCTHVLSSCPWCYGFFCWETPGYCITNITQVLLENLYKFTKLADVNFDFFWLWTLMQGNLREDKICQVSMRALELAKLLCYRFLGFG